nr:hypothetical protein GCM10020092_022790 [Actinoplanes digitatis]
MDGGGNLVIEARKEASNGREYTSARMNTGGKFTAQYGRVEARIKVPKGNGLWPAFWMMGADFLTGRPWPYNGEIDIMEVLGRNTTEGYSTLHAPQYNGGGGLRAEVHHARRGRPLHRVPRLDGRVGQQGHPVPARRNPGLLRQQGDRRGDPRTVDLRPPVLHHPQPRGRRRLPRPDRRLHPVPLPDARRLRPRLQVT